MKHLVKQSSVLSFIICLSLFFLILPAVFAGDDFYKPYLHEAQVPEHPKVKLYGSYSTSLFPGSATYTYPIEVPSGTNSLQPSLSITYNNQFVKQRSGILGAGWSLTQNYVSRDVNSTLDNTSDDWFNLVLSGASYKLVYNANDGFYHTKIESYTRIQNLTGGNNTYGIYWLVTSKDGTQFRFGYNNNSELTSNTGRSYALRWSLDKVTDTHGNSIYYSYLENPFAEDNGTVYLSQIFYNNDQQRKIEFTYESAARLDLRLVYDQGNVLRESRRLSTINISANGNLVRKYVFEYVNLNSEHSLSSLSKIKFYGSDSTYLLHQVSFDYYDSAAGFTKQTAKWISPVSFASDDNDYGVRDVDLNNDGFVDLIQGKDSTSEKKTWLNNKVNNWTDSSATWAPPIYISKSKTVYDLVYECRGSWCSGCDGNCNYDKCFVWGCQCGNGVWYTRGENMCYRDNYDGYDARTIDVDNGVRFADFNSDGFVDILQGVDSTKQVWANNGAGWTNVTSTSAWQPPVSFISDDVDTGARLVDFNGDGRVDILQSSNNGNEVKGAYLNNGTGWVNASSAWAAPIFFVEENKDNGARLEDINGDGLVDIIQSSNAYGAVKKIFINNGTGWTDYSSSSMWQIPVYFITANEHDEGVRLTDLNGDGLVDIVQKSDTADNAWINNGSGWTQNNSWQSPEAFTQNGRNIGRRIADANGDSSADIVVAHTNSSGNFYWTWTKNATTPYMLKTITNEVGGVTSLAYQNSTAFNNTDGDSLSDLGFNVWVVKNVSQNNSLAGSFSVFSNYSYNFSGGKYDYTDFEFRGFNRVDELRPDSSIIKHYFHQNAALKGTEYRTEVFDSSNNPYSRDDYSWTYTNQSGYFNVSLSSQTSYLYDGSTSSPKVTNVTYSYDDYGNVVERAFLGDAPASGDEKYERYAYLYNMSAWIVGKLRRYQLFSSDNATKVKETKYSYDNRLFGESPTKGDVTQIENWLNGGTNPIERFTYDQYGNVLAQTDPRGYVTTYRYGLRDTTYTYVDKVTNALDHVTDYKYDLGTGNLQWQVQNGINSSYYYDAFGRIVKEVQPYDSYELPTKSYNYSFDGVAPETIKVSSRTSANKTFDTYYFYDGFANFVQMKTPAESNQQVVKNIFYDGSGRVKAEQNPYFDNFSASLSTPSSTANISNLTYDTLSRVTVVRNPDGTNKTVSFNHYTINAYDENWHRKGYVLDAYGRIINVLEYNNDPLLRINSEFYVYNTSYAYDTSDNLVQIVDTLGNTYSFTYDSLGRRIALTDPDIGTWTYSYDEVGNLIKQTQIGGGNLVTGDGYYREYNGLNQLVRIRNGSSSTSPVLENYTYDPFGQRIKIMRNDSAKTVIYTPFKEFMMIKNSTGTYNYTYIYQDGVLVARVNPDSSNWYYHADELGSTTLITDQNGNVVEQTFYNPYGEVTSGGMAEYKLYTGYFKDLSCKYYAGARYYNPCLGIFTQPDTLFQDIYNPQSLNHYSYTWNNPYNRVDREGNIVNFVIGAGIGAGINLATQIGLQMAQGASLQEAWANVNWWEVGVNAAVGAATSGVGSLATSLTSNIGSTTLRTVAAFGVRATANVALTQFGIAGTNVARGEPVTQGLFSPSSIIAPIGTAGVQTVMSSLGGSTTSSSGSSSSKIIEAPKAIEKSSSILRTGYVFEGGAGIQQRVDFSGHGDLPPHINYELVRVVQTSSGEKFSALTNLNKWLGEVHQIIIDQTK